MDKKEEKALENKSKMQKSVTIFAPHLKFIEQ